MKNPLSQIRDPDIRGSLPALRRAAREARKLSIQLGTPFYVMKDGKIVDLNRGLKRARSSKTGVGRKGGGRQNAARKRAG